MPLLVSYLHFIHLHSGVTDNVQIIKPRSMSKSNKPEISTFEKLERIESRLKELSDIQKYLFDKYLEVAESDPIYQAKLHKLLKELKGIEIKDSYGVTSNWDELKKNLEIEEKKVKIERLKLENKQLQMSMEKAKNRHMNLAFNASTTKLRSANSKTIKTGEKKVSLLSNLVKHGSFIAVIFVLIVGIYLITLNNRWGYLLTVFSANLLALRKFTLRFLTLEMSGETKE